MHLVIISGSVFGTADLVADEAQGMCQAAGLTVSRLRPLELDALLALAPEALLVCCSTTGMGELPDSLAPLFHSMRDRFPLFTGVPFGVIALGDTAYGDTFCQGGEQMRELLLELQGSEALPMLRLDASETVTPDTDAEPWLQDFIAALRG
ncbi:flavodoxin [Pseudomonas abyssi]|jgi:MioC protein|uniref:Flavodoxin n=1 Tax=Pseudomonas abyssi TaxID=170540 RepID=A0A2A3MMR1_9PSED|nr:flavodoxin domain-containing protein [Pseudomonas abyssi]MAD00460.1 flavodoxin [Pseudomonadales bacterium]PBK06120.1 flavodoxin [Pseudomonas abyssi]|tara:strand:- start:17223 stop:17675 length:453 start_codon:yes stop_codon:yes gene_type:complete